MTTFNSIPSNIKSIADTNLFLALKKCIDYLILSWNTECKGTIELIIKKYENLEVKILISSLFVPDTKIIKHSLANVPDVTIQSNYNASEIRSVERSNDERLLFVHFNSLTATNVQIITNLVRSYLSFVQLQYKSNCRITFTVQDQLNESVFLFESLDKGFFSEINKAVIECVKPIQNQNQNDNNLPTSSFILQNLTGPSSYNLSNIEVKMSLLSTTAGEYKETFFLYLFDPSNFCILNTKKSDPTIEKWINWNEFGITFTNLTPLNENPLKPFWSKKICFTKTVKPCNLVMLVQFASSQANRSIEEKIVESQYFQLNIEHILKFGQELINKACKEVTELALQKGKIASRNRIKEESSVNTATSIFEIVAYSTNTDFRDTCLELMDCASTHEFRFNIYEKLQCYEAQKSKKRKRAQDSWEWNLLEQSSSTFNENVE